MLGFLDFASQKIDVDDFFQCFVNNISLEMDSIAKRDDDEVVAHRGLEISFIVR